MLLSVKIKDAITKEVKAQQTLLKLLESQEKNYGVDLIAQKCDIQNSLDYYNKVLEESE